MRDYDEVWRGLGAPSLRSFGLEAWVKEDRELRRPPELPHSGHAVSPAERDWEHFELGVIEDIAILKAYIKRYVASEPLWAVKANQRLAAVATLLAQPAEVEGRIEIAAPFVTNAKGNWFLPGAGKTEWFKDLEAGPEMVVVPAGRFIMGSPNDEPERETARAGPESPQHQVTIPKPFAVGRFAVTRSQFATFVDDTSRRPEVGRSWKNPGFEQDGTHPVVYVSWHDAKSYIEWLSKVSGAHYRLLSEAEWEYVCRAGTTTPFWWGDTISPERANYNSGGEPYAGGGEEGEYRGRTSPVESFDANAWGLYQVHGNVWEWCEDSWLAFARKPAKLKETGKAWTEGQGDRILRGGGWSSRPHLLRSASRGFDDPNSRLRRFGFRVARTIEA